MDGMGQGDIFVPTNLNSGYYTLVAYTTHMKNWPNKIFYTDDVVVLNPYTNDQAVFWESEETDSLVNVSETLNKNIKESGNKDLELTLDKSQYGKREKVQLTVEAKSRIYGTYSVSVRKRSEEFGYGNRTSLKIT